MLFNLFSTVLISLFILPVSAQQIGDFVYSSDIPLEQLSFSSLWYDIYLIQTQIADNVVSWSVSLLQEDALNILTSIRDISSYQLVSAMRNSSDKIKTLDTYILSLKTLFYKTNSIQHQINSEINSLSSEISSCTRQKKVYDNQYLDALQDANSLQSLESLVLLSQTSASCISSKQTLLNSKQGLSKLLSTEISPLVDKYDYLVANRDFIIKYFDLLDAEYLQKVIDVQDTLKNY